MFRLTLVLALAALAVPVAAAAKGPSQGTISGPGFSKTFKVLYDGGPGSPGGDLTQASGFFPAAFGQSPDPMLHGKPSGPLGARFTIVWTVPGGNNTVFHVRQQLYPYARGGAVSYTKPDQPIFGMGTRGGWYRDAGLKRTLVRLGLPARAPSASGTNFALFAGLGIPGALAVAAAALLIRRRRSTPVSGMQTEV
jgi:hypothetical protein